MHGCINHAEFDARGLRLRRRAAFESYGRDEKWTVWCNSCQPLLNKDFMALTIKRKPLQGVRIGKDIWVYVTISQNNPTDIVLTIVADNKHIIREELLVEEGQEPGPLYKEKAYK